MFPNKLPHVLLLKKVLLLSLQLPELALDLSMLQLLLPTLLDSLQLSLFLFQLFPLL